MLQEVPFGEINKNTTVKRPARSPRNGYNDLSACRRSPSSWNLDSASGNTSKRRSICGGCLTLERWPGVSLVAQTSLPACRLIPGARLPLLKFPAAHLTAVVIACVSPDCLAVSTNGTHHPSSTMNLQSLAWSPQSRAQLSQNYE